MTLFSQENNISPNQKYKITELYLYRPSTKSLWNTYSSDFLISLRSRLLFKHFYTINVTFELKIFRALSVVTRDLVHEVRVIYSTVGLRFDIFTNCTSQQQIGVDGGTPRTLNVGTHIVSQLILKSI